MMYDNVMLDLETLGVMPDAVILSVGAVKFGRDENGKLVFDEETPFHFNCNDSGDQVKAGRTINHSCFDFWMGQNEEAKLSLFDPDIPTGNLHDMCLAFKNWLGIETTAPDDIRVWGNGASFDNAMFKHAYNSMMGREPWPFWADMCVRTVKFMDHDSFCAGRESRGDLVKHNPVDDCISQIMGVFSVIRSTGLTALIER